MSFVGRARSSVERGDTLRAVLTLVAGLRREPAHEEATQLLLELVRDEVSSDGIEHEIAQVLVPLRDRDRILTQMVSGLRGRDEARIADRLIHESKKLGVRFLPEPEQTPEPDPGSEADSEVVPDDEPPDADALEGPDTFEADPSSAQESAPAERMLPVPEPTRHDTAEVRRQALAERRLSEKKQQALAERRAVLAAKRRRRTRAVAFIALLVGIGGVGFYVYQVADRSSDLTAVDAALTSFDRFDPSALTAVREATGAARSEPDFTERVVFAEALAGENVAVRLDGWNTSWGLAGAGIAAVNAGDAENALAIATKTERLYPTDMPTFMARALLEESRGNAEAARAAANRVLDSHPTFAPAHETIIRVAARQFEFSSMTAAVERLSTLDPEHPYATLPKLVDPRVVLLGPREACKSAEVGRGDRFLSAIAAYQSVCSANTAEEFEARAAEALKADPTFVPARLVRAAALVNLGQAEEAAQEFDVAAGSAHSRELRLLVQSAAPVALVAAGRADLAGRFTTPFPKLRGDGVHDVFDEELGDERPELLRKSALTENTVPWAAEALYARVEYFAASGHMPLAQAMLEELAARNVSPARATALRSWYALRADAGHAAAETDLLTKAINDWWAGRHRAVYQMPLEDAPDWWLPLTTQMRAESGNALGRSREVLVALDASKLGLARTPMNDGLRLRAFSHLERQNAGYIQLRDKVSARAKSVTELLDLAYALTWQVELGAADEVLQKISKRAPKDREAAWVCTLHAAARKNDDDAAKCAAVSGRSVEQSPSLMVERGYFALQLGRDETAESRFEAALSADPDSEFAARGLGLAALAIGPRHAAAKLTSVLAGLPEGGAKRARGALLRSLAVANDVHEGNEEALANLEAAAALLGEANVASDRAEYHRAREEWDAAKRFYQGALRHDPYDAAAHVGLARVSIAQNDNAAAQEHLARYLELDPNGRSAGFVRRQLQ